MTSVIEYKLSSESIEIQGFLDRAGFWASLLPGTYMDKTVYRVGNQGSFDFFTSDIDLANEVYCALLDAMNSDCHDEPFKVKIGSGYIACR